MLEPLGCGRAHAQFIEMNQAHTVSGHYYESPFPGTAVPARDSASTVLDVRPRVMPTSLPEAETESHCPQN